MARRPLFGAPVGMDDMAHTYTPPYAPTQQPELPGYQRPSTLQTIAGVIGDALSTAGGGQGLFLPNLLARQNAERQYALGQRERADKFADWQKQYDYERTNPKPSTAAPHYWETNDGSLGVIDPQTGKPAILYQDPTPKQNFIPDGLGGGQWVTVPGTGGIPMAPTAPVGQLKPVGKLTPITGGATPSGSRGFR